jgi:hypothetical protein
LLSSVILACDIFLMTRIVYLLNSHLRKEQKQE